MVVPLTGVVVPSRAYGLLRSAGGMEAAALKAGTPHDACWSARPVEEGVVDPPHRLRGSIFSLVLDSGAR